MQPLQRSYAITEERIEQMLMKGALSGVYDEAKIADYESQGVALADKDKKKYEEMLERKPLYEDILQTLKEHISDKVYKEPESFIKYLSGILSCDKKLTERIADGLSEMDKTAEIQRDKKGNIIYDKETRDTEIVKYTEDGWYGNARQRKVRLRAYDGKTRFVFACRYVYGFHLARVVKSWRKRYCVLEYHRQRFTCRNGDYLIKKRRDCTLPKGKAFFRLDERFCQSRRNIGFGIVR